MAVSTREGLSSCPGSVAIGADIPATWGEGVSGRISRPRRWLINLMRRVWNSALQPWAVRSFSALQWLGISFCPNHYYWPVPDLAELRSRDWPLARPMPGVELDLPRQVQFARGILAGYARECAFAMLPGPRGHEYHYNNGLFESGDAEVTYALVRHFKPRRIVEIGGGYSTRIIAQALLRNASGGQPGELITIEPAPDEVLRNGFPGLNMLIADSAQDVDLGLFATLREGDILFVDSSHVVKTGSDVCYECLEILPRLQPGVLAHFHDIFLPCEYPRQAVLDRLCFWSEQYLLQAFLAMNEEFEVLWSGSAMQMFHPEVLEQAIPHWRASYLRVPPRMRRFLPTLDGNHLWPTSFWMRRKPIAPASGFTTGEDISRFTVHHR